MAQSQAALLMLLAVVTVLLVVVTVLLAVVSCVTGCCDAGCCDCVAGCSELCCKVEAVRDAERNGHANLNGAICYTTLEPCHRGPGHR